MELNPNHPMTRAISNHWDKIAVVLMKKFGQGHVVIGKADLELLTPDTAVTVQELPDGIHLRIVDMETGRRLAREAGGLPV